MEVYRVMDTETTGFFKKGEGEGQPPHQVVEAAFYDVHGEPGTHNFHIGTSAQAFFKPTRPIDIEARAAHHITDNELEQFGLPQEALNDFMHIADPMYFVAHNAEFDMGFFDVRGVRVICTYKAALRAWPDCSKHSNQVIRYYLGLELPPEKTEPAHRALPDAYITANILIELLKLYSPAQLVEWTEQPRLITKCPVGKHYGQPWSEVPASYMNWMLGTDFDEDVKYNIRQEFDRRRKSPPAPHPEFSR